MSSKWFISEIKDYKEISLGYREEQFLQMIANNEWSEFANDIDFYSAYDIYRELNGGEGHKGKARKLAPGEMYPIGADDSISYKDVHKRVKRLETLDLIEPVDIEPGKQKQKSKRKIIKYTVTSRGLFQCCLYFQWSRGCPTKIPLMLLYKDNVIYQTLLYQYFQEETVREILSIFLYDVFLHYLRKCCEGILEILDYARWLEVKTQDRIKDIDDLIKKELKNLIYEIVLESSNEVHKDKFPNRVLRDDKQLCKLVDDLTREVNQGFQRLFH